MGGKRLDDSLWRAGFKVAEMSAQLEGHMTLVRDDKLTSMDNMNRENSGFGSHFTKAVNSYVPNSRLVDIYSTHQD